MEINNKVVVITGGAGVSSIGVSFGMTSGATGRSGSLGVSSLTLALSMLISRQLLANDVTNSLSLASL